MELKPEMVEFAIFVIGSLTCIFTVIVKLIKRGDVKSFLSALKDYFGGTDLLIISIEHEAFIYAMEMTKDVEFISYYEKKRQELINKKVNKKELREVL